MGVGTGGTRGTCPLPTFFKFVCKVPLSAYTVPFLLIRVPVNACAPPHFLNASYVPGVKDA